ncbi:MAG TPA: hypothetical protein VED86_06790 [archaeon]|nr:hypothetical protein [archaeon]
MRIRKAKTIGIILCTLGLIFLCLGTIMPYYKSPQRLEGSGPGIEFTASRPYWINSYFIPPINAGQPISLTVLSDRAGATTVVLAYYDQNLQSIVGPPLVDVIFGPDQKGLVAFTRADRSGPYFLTIDSFNSSFSFYITSVWSPFYWLRTLAVYSFGLLPVGAVIVYYDGISEQREKMVEKALHGIKQPRL